MRQPIQGAPAGQKLVAYTVLNFDFYDRRGLPFTNTGIYKVDLLFKDELMSP